jgi:hypothetical protein
MRLRTLLSLVFIGVFAFSLVFSIYGTAVASDGRGTCCSYPCPSGLCYGVTAPNGYCHCNNAYLNPTCAIDCGSAGQPL